MLAAEFMYEVFPPKKLLTLATSLWIFIRSRASKIAVYAQNGANVVAESKFVSQMIPFLRLGPLNHGKGIFFPIVPHLRIYFHLGVVRFMETREKFTFLL